MKKLIFGLLLTAFMADGYAQSGGIIGGVNFSNQTVSGNGIKLDTKSFTGLHVGTFFTFMFSKDFGVHPEILYSTQGWDVNISNINLNLRTENLNIPILLRYNVTDMFHVDAGPQFGILLSAKGTVAGTSMNVKSDYNSGDFGFAFGAGVDLKNGIIFSARYIAGLSDVDPTAMGSSKNTNFQLSVGRKLFDKVMRTP